MDFKYLLSRSESANKGTIAQIQNNGVVPTSNFGNISRHGKYDNIFDFKTDFKNTQIKKRTGTNPIIQLSNASLTEREKGSQKWFVFMRKKK
jgi:hypothetical protein